MLCRSNQVDHRWVAYFFVGDLLIKTSGISAPRLYHHLSIGFQFFWLGFEGVWNYRLGLRWRLIYRNPNIWTVHTVHTMFFAQSIGTPQKRPHHTMVSRGDHLPKTYQHVLWITVYYCFTHINLSPFPFPAKPVIDTSKPTSGGGCARAGRSSPHGESHFYVGILRGYHLGSPSHGISPVGYPILYDIIWSCMICGLAFRNSEPTAWTWHTGAGENQVPTNLDGSCHKWKFGPIPIHIAQFSC